MKLALILAANPAKAGNLNNHKTVKKARSRAETIAALEAKHAGYVAQAKELKRLGKNYHIAEGIAQKLAAQIKRLRGKFAALE